MRPAYSTARALQALMGRPILATLALFALVVATYAGALDNGFHFDDFNNFVEVGAFHLDTLSLDTLRAALEQAELKRRVLPNATLVLDWWRGDGSPLPFQQTNILIHALCTLAVMAFAYQMLGLSAPAASTDRRMAIALAVAALWAVHPIQVQAVTYVVQRMASMVALFYLLATVAYVRMRLSRRVLAQTGWGALCLLSGAAAFLCKENSWMLPATLVLAEYGLCRRDGPVFRYWFDRYLWLLVALALVYILADLFLLHGPLRVKQDWVYLHRDFTMEERLLTQPRVLFFHLGQMLWPLPGRFSLEHDFATSTGLMTPATTLPAILAVAAWAGAGLACLFSRRARVAGFLLLFPLVTLVPEATVHGLEMVFEHRLYLPAVGLFALLGCGAQALLRHMPRLGTPLGLVACVITLLLSWATIERLPDWRDDVTLGQASVAVAPRLPRAWLNLGLAQKAQGLRVEARTSILRAVELGWDRRPVLDKAALALAELGERAEAIRVLGRLRALNGPVAMPRQQKLLGDVLFECGRLDEARATWREILELTPWDASITQRLESPAAPGAPAPGCDAAANAS